MDLLTQAKEDLQRERMANTFKMVLPWAAGLLLIVLVSVGAREAYEAYTQYQSRKNTDRYMLALQNAGSLDALLDLAKNDNSERGVMAGLTAFARMTPAEQESKGIPALQNLVNDKDLPDDWRALAALILVKAQIAFGADASKADTMLAILKPALDHKASPWHGLASVQAALIAGEMKRDPKSALVYLKEFDSDKISPQLAAQMTKLQTRYGILSSGEK